MLYTLVSRQDFDGNFVSPIFTMPSGVTFARVKISFANVENTTANVNLDVENSTDGGNSFNVVHHASIVPPTERGAKASSSAEFGLDNPSGMFRAVTNIVGRATVEVSVLTTP